MQSAVLWGLIGGLTFGVLAQAAVALSVVDLRLVEVLVGIAVVSVLATGATYRYEPRLRAWAADRGR